MQSAATVNKYLALFSRGCKRVQMSALTLRIDPELHQRLEQCAERTHIKKYTLAILAVTAAVEAIEKNQYRLVVPIQFDVARVPMEKTGTKVASASPLSNPASEDPIPKKKRAA
jgi:CRISPR/Cas system-associated endoribonuclease Cas2